MAKNVIKIILGCGLAVAAWIYVWPNLLLLVICYALIAFLLLWPKIFTRVLVSIVALLLLIWLLIQTSPVQNFIIGKITSKLSKDLKTTVKIGHVNFSLFDKVDLNNTLILDHQKDTLLKAGSLKLRITDWFFLKQNIELKYIGLEDAVIKQQRSDSTWNYQFLIDYFSSPDKAKQQSKRIILKLQKLDLKNVVYIKVDDWRGQRTVLKTGSLLVDADNIDITKKLILIKSIDMDKTYYNIENFDGIDTTQKKAVVRDSGSMYFNPANLRVRVTNFNIKDCFFGTGLRDEVPQEGFFDGRKLMVSKINGTIKNFNFIKDTITANIDLSAEDRSGFKLKSLKAQYKLTPQKMEFSNLYLKTNHSTITNYFVMQFRDFKKDMADYINSVNMKANIKNSLVYSDDIAFFAPALSKWNQQFILNGSFNGIVNDFSVKNLFAKNGNNTYVSGNLEVKNTTDPGKINITLNGANVQTNSREIAFILPQISSIKSPDLAALGNVHFVGDFTGTLSNFNTRGTFSTALGGLYTNLSLSFPAKAEPAYKGEIQTRQFDLGKFLSVADLGNVTFKGNVQGKSFNLSKISTRLSGNFTAFDFKGYEYHNLSFDGEIVKRNFQGEFIAADTNFNFTSNIVIDLNGDAPAFNIIGDLVNANLHPLHFANDSIVVAGLFDVNFKGRNIDDFLGYAKILNANIYRNDKRLYLDSITLSTAIDTVNNVKTLTFESGDFLAKVEGQYNILQLPQSFQSFLNHYYPSYINPPKTELSNQNFKVTIQTGNFEDYASLIDSNLRGFDDALLTGDISTLNGNHFNFEIDIPSAGYKKLSVEDAKFTGDGDKDSLLLTGNVGRFYVSDSMYFPNTKISISSANDLSHVIVATSANKTLNDAQLDADVRTMPEGVSITFHPSSFVLNTKKWNLENQGEVVIKKNFSSAKNMKFVQGFQEISIESESDKNGESNALAIRLKDVDIGDIFPLFVTNPLMEGIATGSVYLRDIYTNFNADGKIQVSQFRLNNDSVGVVEFSTSYKATDGKILFGIKANNENFVLNSDGFYNLKDSLNKPLQTTMHLDHAKVGILNGFLNTLFDNITGYATGTIHLDGSFKDLHLTGQTHLDSGALTVKYTQVRYFIPSADFVFYDDRFDFGNFEIKDKFGNTGKVSGILNETAFKNNRYSFNMSTNNLLLLDTKAKDNPLFYGMVIGKANLSLNGPQENMQMSISGEPTDQSHIYVQTNSSKKSADADFIIFKQYGEQPQKDTSSVITNLSINLDLTANNKVTVSVILDELTGDIIEATGNGRMLIKVPAIGDVSMNGRYNIEQGNYNFNFQSLVKKPFELLPNQNSYIEWTGDPYNAVINITARYTAKNVSISDLVSNSGISLDQTIAGYRGDVYVIADLVGKLTKPQINFRLDFPEGSAIRTNDNFSRLLAKMESDENEMLKQVTWLIVFDSFSPYGEISSNQTFVQAAAYNTISQKIASVLNSKISDLLYSLTGDRTLQFDVGAKTYSSYSINGASANNANTLDRTAVELKLNKSLLNNKLIITFGGDLDFNVSGAAAATATNNNLQWLPDISIQIILSRDRKLRAIVFNHSSLGSTNTGTIGRVTRQGISISYTKDFDRLFGKNDEIFFVAPTTTDTTSRKQKRGEK